MNTTQEAMPPIFFINMKENGDRLKSMQQQLQQLSLSYQRVEAVDGSALSVQEIQEVYCPRLAQQYTGRELALAELGCYLSHVQAMRHIMESNAPYGLIMEDDVVINPDIVSVLSDIKKLPKEWQVIQLGNAYNRHPGVHWCRQKYSVGPGYEVGVPLYCIYGTQGYVISRELCQQFVHDKQRIVCPIDHRLFDIFLSFSFFHALKGKQILIHNNEVNISSIESTRAEARDETDSEGAVASLRQYLMKRIFSGVIQGGFKWSARLYVPPAKAYKEPLLVSSNIRQNHAPRLLWAALRLMLLSLWRARKLSVS